MSKKEAIFCSVTQKMQSLHKKLLLYGHFMGDAAICTRVFFNILVWYKYVTKFHKRLTHQTSGVLRYWVRKKQHIALLLKKCSLCIKNHYFTVILWAMQQFWYRCFSIYLLDTNVWPNFIRDWHIRPMAPWDNEQERSNILLCN